MNVGRQYTDLWLQIIEAAKNKQDVVMENVPEARVRYWRKAISREKNLDKIPEHEIIQQFYKLKFTYSSELRELRISLVAKTGKGSLMGLIIGNIL
jgi:hypothetical protein